MLKEGRKIAERCAALVATKKMKEQRVAKTGKTDWYEKCGMQARKTITPKSSLLFGVSYLNEETDRQTDSHTHISIRSREYKVVLQRSIHIF
jgi:hypothetical protein